MKNKPLIGAACLLGIMAAIVSCASAAFASKEMTVRRTDFSRTVLMFPDKAQESPRMDCNFSLLEAIGRPADMQFINQNLYQGRTPALYADALVQNRQAGYLENRELAAAEAPAIEGFNWSYSETMDFSLLKERCMVVKRETYAYSGGAHGLGSVRYYVFDLAERRVLTMDDFFREGTDVQLYDIISAELRRYNDRIAGTSQAAVLGDDKPLSQGIFSTDTPAITDNFFITNDGFGLNWAPYEIAPYAAGSIEITLPWKEIRPLLRHEIMELLEKFGIEMFM